MVASNKLNKKTLSKLSKKICAYSAAAGAVAAAGAALDANAAPIIYDTEATPIDVHSSFNTLPNGQNMAAIDPTVLGASATRATTSPTAAGLIGAATGASDNSGITNGQLSGTVYFRYEIFSEPSATWGKSGTQFGILTGTGNGLYALQTGTAPSTRPVNGTGLTGGFSDSDTIGDGDSLISSDTVGADAITQAYSLGPGAATQADIDGFGAFATGSHYSVVTGTKYLGFRMGNRNGFVKFRPFAGQRNHLEIYGWGLETTPFAPIHASLVSAAPVPEPGTIAMLALGGAGLLALRRRRRASQD